MAACSHGHQRSPKQHAKAGRTGRMMAMTPRAMGFPGDGGPGAVAGFPALGALVTRMKSQLAQLRERRDPRRFFRATYLRTTRAVGAELAAGGFLDAAWVERWDVAFAEFYLDALEADVRAGPVPGPWAAAFAAADDPASALPPLRHVLLGMNAHINYDLPRALLAVISDAELADPALLARRAADHRHIDRVTQRAGRPTGEAAGSRRRPCGRNESAARPGRAGGHQAVPHRGASQGLGQRPRPRRRSQAG